MREIKFRLYNKKTKKMYGWENLCKMPAALSILNDGEDNEKWSCFMQYTGLKDKNGKEIYEGDIDADDYNNLSVICYIEKYGAYCAVPLELYLHEDYENEVVYSHGYDCYFHNVTPKKYLNIIGNIYENPELLEESK
ncbi:YopX family protein [Bacillus cereus]|uniref:YopX family protein n=1 Tax=Bacillus cereus TaxID=1396 RepID=UPI000BFE425C|nr:YopX family protein [Bacillus cereus]PGT05082.1 hypothetical protein COD03_29780 [Bacillus cereus]